ncbi:hypothetical protein [Flexistipes sinusarabici]|uniref:Lipoprotein n=1 Tax=Flexistipes sinusarabici TaxID=2352 RepID=A0A3D5QCI4_FLESI|nr:hypothetical protein [Flexistipes sinusarabici]HCW93453.1 hypothetical protein [Flexistipes sinusarabici]
MRKIVLMFGMSVLLFMGCAKPYDNFSSYVFNPKNEYGREVKSKYIDSLYNAYKEINQRAIPLQQPGLGFTSGQRCGDLCNNEPGDFWFYIVSPHKKPVSIRRYESINKRAYEIFRKKVPDIIHALKYAPSEKLIKDEHFEGIVIGTTWPVYGSIGEYFNTKKYEQGDIFIPFGLLEKYVKYEIYMRDLLCGSHVFASDAEKQPEPVDICT